MVCLSSMSVRAIFQQSDLWFQLERHRGRLMVSGDFSNRDGSLKQLNVVRNLQIAVTSFTLLLR